MTTGTPAIPRSHIDSSARDVRLAAAAARVRALMRAFEGPLDLMARIDGAARFHLDAITPDLAVLDAQPFASLPDIVLETPADEVLSRSSRTPEPLPVRAPTRAPRVAQPPALSQTLAATTAPLARATAHTRDVPQSLPVNTNRRVASDPVNAPGSRFVLPVGGFARSAHTTRADAITLHDPATVRRDVAEHAASHELSTRDDTGLSVTPTRAARATDLARAAESAATVEPSQAQVVRETRRSLLTPARHSVAARPSLPVYRLSAARVRPAMHRVEATHAGQVDVDTPHVVSPTAGGVSTPIDRTAAQRGAWRFYLDPREPRAPADESDDDLADRISEVLREQARRQGVDLT